LMARQAWTARLGRILPGVGTQAILHRVAGTDLPAQLAYQDRIADFHREIRTFYYGYLFNDRPFGQADYAKRPTFAPHVAEPALPWGGAVAMTLVGLAVLSAGLGCLQRLRVLAHG